MTVWLCPLRPRSWNVIRRKNVFGVPRYSQDFLSSARPNDILVFHVLRPTSGIVAVGKINSEIYEDTLDLWGDNRYPLRVKIEILQEYSKEDNGPIPLAALSRRTKNQDIGIEPFLQNVWVARVTENQYHNLKEYIRVHYGESKIPNLEE